MCGMACVSAATGSFDTIFNPSLFAVDGMRNSCSQMAQAAADARACAGREFANDPDSGLAHSALLMSQCAAMYQRVRKPLVPVTMTSPMVCREQDLGVGS